MVGYRVYTANCYDSLYTQYIAIEYIIAMTSGHIILWIMTIFLQIMTAAVT